MTYPGSTADPATLAGQVHKARQQFKLKNVVFTAGRDMLNNSRIEAELRDTVDLEWITALRHEAIAKLAQEPLQITLFDSAGPVTFTYTDFPGERLVA